MKIRYGILSLLFVCIQASAQVNTERYHQDYDKPGFIYFNSLGFNFASGNTRYLELSNNFRADYNGDKNDYLLVAEYAFKTSSGTRATNKGFLHLRNTRVAGQKAFLMTETFTQLQFDEFLLLRSRFLLGGGLRFDPAMLIDSTLRKMKMLKVFVGTGIFYEFEQYSSNPPEKFHLLRWSNYLSLVWAANAQTSINFVNYLQPATEDFKNIRYHMNLMLSTLITNKFYYDLSLSYSYRSMPVGGKKPDDLEVKNTLRFKL